MQYQSAKDFFKQYERLLIPGMLLAGVTADFITFRTIEVRTAFILLSVYATIAGITIAFLNLYEEKRIATGGNMRYARLAAPLVLQFTFGALLSASLVFYWFSGAFSVSWPLIVLIALLMASNDVFRHYYLKPVVQVGVYFFILFSLLSLVLPYAFNSIEVWVFLLSGAGAMLLIFTYVHILSPFIERFERKQSKMAASVFVIYGLLNAFYILNLIPPIPLSLREAGVYHNIERKEGTYVVAGEREHVLDRIIPGQTIHTQPGNEVYVFTSIFAPGELATDIYHDWQWFNEETGKWERKDRLSFFVSGGREDGYRGFSVKTTVPEGKWRVDVETQRGQVLGRLRFKVEHVEELPAFEEVTK